MSYLGSLIRLSTLLRCVTSRKEQVQPPSLSRILHYLMSGIDPDRPGCPDVSSCRDARTNPGRRVIVVRARPTEAPKHRIGLAHHHQVEPLGSKEDKKKFSVVADPRTCGGFDVTLPRARHHVMSNRVDGWLLFPFRSALRCLS